MKTSRGIESIAAVLFTGSMETTSIVSVFRVDASPSRVSMPSTSTLRRSLPLHAGGGACEPLVVADDDDANGAKRRAASAAHGADWR